MGEGGYYPFLETSQFLPLPVDERPMMVWLRDKLNLANDLVAAGDSDFEMQGLRADTMCEVFDLAVDGFRLRASRERGI